MSQYLINANAPEAGMPLKNFSERAQMYGHEAKKIRKQEHSLLIKNRNERWLYCRTELEQGVVSGMTNVRVVSLICVIARLFGFGKCLTRSQGQQRMQ